MSTVIAKYPVFSAPEAAECFNGCGYLDTERTLKQHDYPRGKLSARCPECGMRTWFDVIHKDSKVAP